MSTDAEQGTAADGTTEQDTADPYAALSCAVRRARLRAAARERSSGSR